MKSVEKRINDLEIQVERHDEIISHITPVVKQAAHKNVIVWIAVVITILNLIILILNE